MRPEWCEQLVSIGLSTYSDNNKKILSEIASRDIPVCYATLTEASAESIIIAVAKMIEENNKILQSEISQ